MILIIAKAVINSFYNRIELPMVLIIESSLPMIFIELDYQWFLL